MKHSSISVWLAAGLLLIAVFSTSPARAQGNEASLYVGLTNGQVIYPESSLTLRERNFGGSYLVVDGKDQVLLSDVLYFKNQDGYFIYEPVENSSRRTLMKREFEGPITLYSVTRMVYNNNYDPYSYGRFGGGSVREKVDYYFRKFNGPVMRYKYRNLKAAVADTPEAAQLIQEVGRTRFLIYSMYVGGGALSVYGALYTLSGGGLHWSTLVGAVVLAIPNFFANSVDAKMEQAILLYNKLN